MKKILIKTNKALHHFHLIEVALISKCYCIIIFYLNGVKTKSFISYGFPYIHLSLNARCTIGENFKMNNGARYSDLGYNGKCRIDLRDSALLTIGNNVGMSDVTISCHERITIGDNIILGAGVQLRDTDSHSLNPLDRLNGQDWTSKKTSPIVIKNNVFIGACSIVLKGVTIGNNAIIGAASVVTKNIPDNEIWAGNPARFVKQIKNIK